MKFFKPAWVGHDGNPIFSIDIHPDGTRFATGGQGPEKCGRIIIWNMAPILSSKDEHKSEIPKKLCQMDNHLACINCVRWSNHGKYLASAGDDKNLMVWQMSGKSYNHPSTHQAQSSVFESANIEQWRCIATLNGHNGDILDLAWSVHDQYLASCSVDNMIIVWDANNFPQMITKITGHTGLVKGVSWDPAGKYLASQSDDKTVRIWKTTDWKEETVIKEPFKECGGTTHVLRLNWSPDGQTLVSAHAMNNSGSVAQLIERDGWKTKRDLVGHRKAITCVRFNPNLLYQNKQKKHADRSGSGNNNSQTATPNNITTTNSTSNNNGNNSASSITNGTSSSKTSGNNKSSSSASKNKYCCIAVGSRDRSISIWLTSQPRPLIVTHDLFESSVLDISWSKDGYRLLACSQDGTVAAMSFSPSELGHKLTSEERQAHFQKLYGKSINSTPTNKKTIIVEDPELISAAQVEQQNSKLNRDILHDQLSSHSNSISQNGFNGCESNTSISGMSKGPTDRQIETFLPGGKRRITPLYIQPSLPFNSTSNITFSSSKESKTKIMIETTTSTPIPQTPTPSYVPTTPNKNNTPTHTHTNNNTIPIIKKEHITPRTIPKALAPARLDRATVFRIKSSDDKELVLEAENDINSMKLSELRLMDETNNKVWDVLLSSRINSVIATEILAAASCVDNSLHLFKLTSGRRLLPPIVLDSPVSHIAAEKAHLLVITSCANMWLWDFGQSKKVLVKGESVSSILTPTNWQPSTSSSERPSTQQTTSKSQVKGANDKAKSDNQNNYQTAGDRNNQSDLEILSCSLTKEFQPALLLSTGKAFVFHYDLQCWMRIDANDLITRLSSCKPSLAAIQRFIQEKVDPEDESNCMRKNLPLASLQSQHSFDIKQFANLINKNGSESLRVKATRSFLDQQLASALAIKSPGEYRIWLIKSVHHFVDTGAESRLKDLCSRLASSSDELANLGLNNLSLLQEILIILSRNLRYQRIYSEYNQLLDYAQRSAIN